MAHQLLKASVDQHEMMLLRLVALGKAREPDNLPLWHRVIHPFFLNFVLLLNQNISFFDLVLINCLILLIWVLNFELDILNIFDEPNHLLSFDLHMVFKLVLMHQVLVSQAISVPGVRYGQLNLGISATVCMEMHIAFLVEAFHLGGKPVFGGEEGARIVETARVSH